MGFPVVAGAPHGGWSPTFRKHLEAILPLKGDALDLGTGTGRVALEVAPRVRRAVGVDIDGGAIQAAQEAAGRAGIRNVKFYVADAERVRLVDLNDGSNYELITAHLFLSAPLLGRLPDAVATNGHVLLYALAEDNWKEAGGSKFNLPIEDVVDALTSHDLGVQDACIEQVIHEFASTDAAKAYLKEHRLWTTWSEDGRWENWKRSLRSGGRRLTESRMVVWAAR